MVTILAVGKSLGHDFHAMVGTPVTKRDKVYQKRIPEKTSKKLTMIYQYFSKTLAASFLLADREGLDEAFEKADRHLKFLWNRSEKALPISVDGMPETLMPNQIICFTYNQNIHFLDKGSDFIMLFFNKEFYCIHTFDQEVSCNGLLFFGSDYTPVLQLDDHAIVSLGTLVKVLQQEFKIKDNNQEEMLRILLKRFIISCTRLARIQLLNYSPVKEEVDLVRQFNALVEEHFKSKKSVIEYAALLHKSPKTLGNIFAKVSKKSPLQVIHERLATEAKRLLIYTDNPIKAIGYELGYQDYAQFSKFFKKTTGVNPQEFRVQNISLGKSMSA